MAWTFDEAAFRAMWRGADEVFQLQARAREVLHDRSVSTFDGLGHLLDYVLPDELIRLERIATTVRMPSHHLSLLRAGEVDPLGLPMEAVALLGRVTGLDCDTLAALVRRDHERFVPMGSDMTARGNVGAEAEEAIAELREAWSRLTADDAAGL